MIDNNPIPNHASATAVAEPDIDQSQLQEPKKVAVSPQWFTDLLCINIFHDYGNCYGEANPSRQKLFSSDCGQVQNCTTSASFLFNIYFYVDAEGVSRPTPFTPPKLTIDLKFTTIDGAVIFQKQATDNNPVYSSPGHPYQPSFGKNFTINTSKSGKLAVNLKLQDNDSGKVVRYTDTIECIVGCS